jgi:hypothetical protein
MPEATSNHTTAPSRRRFLSQAAGAATGGAVLTLAAIPPALASAAAAVAMNSGAQEPPAIDHKAILARVEEITDVLRTKYVSAGWKIDEDGAERAVAYFRRHVEGPPFKDEDEDTIEYHRAIEFLGSHGQSLDWIHDGNPGGMICRLAKHSQRASVLAAASANADPIDAKNRPIG